MRSVILTSLLLVYSSSIASAQVAGFALGQQDIVAMYIFQGQDEASYKRNLEARTLLRVKHLSTLVALEDSQSQKLELALRGDINRFYREIDEMREKTKDMSPNNPQEMQKAWQIMQPLYQKVFDKGILSEDSLYHRMTSLVLNEEQQQKYKTYQKRRELHFRDAVMDALIAELEKSIPLLSSQREKFRAIARKTLEKGVQIPDPGFGRSTNDSKLHTQRRKRYEDSRKKN